MPPGARAVHPEVSVLIRGGSPTAARRDRRSRSGRSGPDDRGSPVNQRILIVDDEADLRELVRYQLEKAGFQTRQAATGSEALDAARSWKPDAVVLDLMLPDIPGTDVCRVLRSDPVLRDIAVIMLTARSEEVDRVVGFELGADDYVTKPFSPRELTLRLKAVLKRLRRGAVADEDLRIGDLLIQRGSHRAYVKGRELTLTATEFKLLTHLVATRGRVQTRDYLLDAVWGDETHVTLRTVDTHMKRLREKLGPVKAYIETVRGVGYRFRDVVA